jgi:serine/threonine kinase 16
MALLVLYRFETFRYGNWIVEDEVNAFEAPILGDENKEVLLGDLLQFILGSKNLSKSLGVNYGYYADLGSSIISLPHPSSVVPISANNTLSLRLRPASTPPMANTPDLNKMYYELSKQKLVPSSSTGSKPRKPERRDYGTSQSLTASAERSSNEDTQWNSATNTNAPGLNTIVGDEAVTAISEAAKSIFSFAATVGKSVLDAATNVSKDAIAAAAASGTGIGNGSKLQGVLTVGQTRITITSELAEGGFGTVYGAQDMTTGQSYALKQLLIQSKEQWVEAKAEVEHLLLFRGHPNIIELIEYSKPSSSTSTGGGGGTNTLKQYLLLFPMYTQGTAWDRIEKANADPNLSWPFSEQVALEIILATAKALQYIHEKGYSHRDIKPHNILLASPTENMNHHVVMDFGSIAPGEIHIRTRSDALALEDEASRKTSMAYRPPELAQAPYLPMFIDGRVDIWSLGCTMFCIAFGRSPFETPRDGIQKLAIMNGRYITPTDRRSRNVIFSTDYTNLIDGMLQIDITRRSTANEIVQRIQSLLG